MCAFIVCLHAHAQATAVPRFWSRIDTLIDAYAPPTERATGVAQLPFSTKLTYWIAEHRRGGVRGNRILRMPYREEKHLTTPWKWLQHHGKVKMDEKPDVYVPPLWLEESFKETAGPMECPQASGGSESCHIPPKKRTRQPQFPPSPDMDSSSPIGSSATTQPAQPTQSNVNGSNVTVNNFCNFSSVKNNIGITEFETRDDDSDDNFAYLGKQKQGGKKKTSHPPNVNTAKKPVDAATQQPKPKPSVLDSVQGQPRTTNTSTQQANKEASNIVVDSSDEEGAHLDSANMKESSVTQPKKKKKVEKKTTEGDEKAKARLHKANEKRMKLLKTTTMLKKDTKLYIPGNFFADFESPAEGFWRGHVETNAPRGRPTQVKVKVANEPAFFAEVDDAIKWLEQPTKEDAAKAAEAVSDPLSSEPSLPSTSELADDESDAGDSAKYVDDDPETASSSEDSNNEKEEEDEADEVR